MKTKLVTVFLIFLIIQISFGQQSELEKLEQRKIELENQIKPLSNELKTVEAKIKEIEKKEALIKLKKGASFNVKLSANGKVRDFPNTSGKVLFKLKEGAIVSAHKRKDSYFYITTYEGNAGWIHDVLLKKDEAYKTMMEGFALLEEDKQKQAKLNKQATTIPSKLEANDPDPTGKQQESEDWVTDKNNPETTNTETEQDILKQYNSKVLDTETSGTSKKTIYIQIPEQLTNQQLENIAIQLKNENSTFDRLFIFYYLPNMKIGSGAWASTHYNKDLKVKIYGVDKSAEEKIRNAGPSSGVLVGKWYDKTPGIEHSIIISKIGSKYILKRAFRDGSVMEKDLKFSLSNGKMKFVYESDVGEYLLIEKNGQLGEYDKYGLIDKCDKIK